MSKRKRNSNVASYKGNIGWGMSNYEKKYAIRANKHLVKSYLKGLVK